MFPLQSGHRCCHGADRLLMRREPTPTPTVSSLSSTSRAFPEPLEGRISRRMRRGVMLRRVHSTRSRTYILTHTYASGDDGKDYRMIVHEHSNILITSTSSTLSIDETRQVASTITRRQRRGQSTPQSLPSTWYRVTGYRVHAYRVQSTKRLGPATAHAGAFLA